MMILDSYQRLKDHYTAGRSVGGMDLATYVSGEFASVLVVFSATAHTRLL